MLESKFKRLFKRRLQEAIPEIAIFEPDPDKARSVPDMMIFGSQGWAALEFKRSKYASHQPNQDYRITKLNEMGSAFIVYPENEEEVFHELVKLFTS